MEQKNENNSAKTWILIGLIVVIVLGGVILVWANLGKDKVQDQVTVITDNSNIDETDGWLSYENVENAYSLKHSEAWQIEQTDPDSVTLMANGSQGNILIDVTTKTLDEYLLGLKDDPRGIEVMNKEDGTFVGQKSVEVKLSNYDLHFVTFGSKNYAIWYYKDDVIQNMILSTFKFVK